MENALFKNEFVRDKNTAKEIHGYWFFKRPLMIVIYALFGVYTALILLTSILFPEISADFSIVSLMVLAYLALLIIPYRMNVNAMVKRDEELAKGREFLCEISVTDTEIIHTALENNQSIGFESISHAFITKSYVAVVSKARIIYIFKKDGFTVGDCDGFVAFLKEKGIKIK